MVCRAFTVPQPQKKKIKKKIVLLPPNSKVFPVKNTFLRMYAARSFFCVLFGMSPFYTTWADGTRFTPPRHSGAVDAWWPRGRGGGSPICQVGARKGRQNGTKKTAKKSEKKNVRASTSVSARGLLFFFLLCFSAHHRHCRLELRGVGVQRCLYGRSALSCSNVNVPFTIQPGLRRSAPTTLHLFLLLLLGARGKDLIHLRYSNPQRNTPALIRSSVSLP